MKPKEIKARENTHFITVLGFFSFIRVFKPDWYSLVIETKNQSRMCRKEARQEMR